MAYVVLIEFDEFRGWESVSSWTNEKDAKCCVKIEKELAKVEGYPNRKIKFVKE